MSNFALDTYLYLRPIIGRGAADAVLIFISVIYLTVFVGIPVFAIISSVRMRRRGITTETPVADRRAKLQTRTLRVNYVFYVLGRWALAIAFAAAGIFMNLLTAMWIGRFTLWATNQPWFIAASVLVAWRLYAVRARFRFGYGAAEVFVGVAAVVAAVFKPTSVDPQNYNQLDDLSHTIAVVGGIYIIVRGLVDMEDGMPAFLPRLAPSNQRRLQAIWEVLKR